MATRIDADPRALIAARQRRERAMTKRKNVGLTKRVKLALETLVFGLPDAPQAPVTLKQAADAVGLSERAVRAALTKPNVLGYYQQQVRALRDGERANNIRTAIEIRDSTTLKESAAGQRVRLLAAQRLDADIDQQPGNSVSVNVGIGVQMTPGYVIDLSEPEPRTIEHDDVGTGYGADGDEADQMHGAPVPPLSSRGPDFDRGEEKSRRFVQVDPHTRDYPPQEPGQEFFPPSVKSREGSVEARYAMRGLLDDADD